MYIVVGTKVGSWRFAQFCRVGITTTNDNSTYNVASQINKTHYVATLLGGGVGARSYSCDDQTPTAYFGAVYF